MAKQLLRTYVFTPGGAGAGSIILPGNYTSNQLLLITNTTSNVIIYNFANVGNTGTTATFTRSAHPSFPGQLGNSDGYTTITLAVATTAMSANDNLQIFVDTPYQVVKCPVQALTHLNVLVWQLHKACWMLTLSTDYNPPSGNSCLC